MIVIYHSLGDKKALQGERDPTRQAHKTPNYRHFEKAFTILVNPFSNVKRQFEGGFNNAVQTGNNQTVS